MYLELYIAIIFNISPLVYLWWKYGLSSLIHPFNYYLISWSISLLSLLVGLNVGLDFFLIVDEELFIQLLNTITFVGLAILLVLVFSKSKLISKNLTWHIPSIFLKLISSAILADSIYNLFRTGFNVAENRNEWVSQNLENALQGYSTGLFSAIIGVFFFLKIPLLVYNGIQFYRIYFIKSEKSNYYIYFILLSSLFNVISTGGRSGLIDSLLYFFLGIILCHLKTKSIISTKYLFSKIFKIGLLPIIFVVLYINYVSDKRYELYQTSNVTKEYFSKTSFGSTFYGIMEYSVYHVLGYQLRLKDLRNHQPELGQYTFQFITTFNIPIISQLYQQEINLGKLLDSRRVNTELSTLGLKDEKAEQANTTSSIFHILFLDFGFYGSLLVIFVFTILSQYIFLFLYNRPVRNYKNLVFYLFIFFLWKNTWFSHHLNGPIFNPYLYSLLLLYFIDKIFKKKVILKNTNPVLSFKD